MTKGPNIVADKLGCVRVGVIPLALDGAALDAFRYLLLKANHYLRTMEFELCPEIEHEFLDKLGSKHPLDRASIQEEAIQFVQEYRSELRRYTEEYEIDDKLPDGYVILSNARFTDYYYAARSNDVQIIALGNWARDMAPPSIVEFFLFLTLRYGVGFVHESFARGRHYNTRGCLWDFSPALDEARYTIIGARVCPRCQDSLKDAGLLELADDLPPVVSGEWIGVPSNPTSPAAMVKRLGYDLFITKGLKPTRWETIQSVLTRETVKQLLNILAVVVVSALLVWLGIKG